MGAQAIGAVIGLEASTALGVLHTWTFAGPGNWSTASNWTNGVPGASADVLIWNNMSANPPPVVTFDYTGGSILFNNLSVVHSTHFVQNTNVFNATNESVFGGNWTLGGGTHNVSIMGLAYDPDGLPSSVSGSAGTLTAGHLTTNLFRMGYGNHGSFNHSGGTHTCSELLVGRDKITTATASAQYVQSGGTLSTNSTIVGQGDLLAIFTMSGGVCDFNGPVLVGAVSSIARGTINLSGTGVMNLNYMLSLGEVGTAIFAQSGGTLNTAGNTQIGELGSGTFLHSAGLHTGSGSVNIGGVSAAGRYIMSGGTFNVASCTVNSGGTLILNGGFWGGTTRITKGTLTAEEGFTARGTGVIHFDPTANIDGPTARGIIDGRLIVSGTVNLNDTTISGAGSITLEGSFGTLRGRGNVNVREVSSAGMISSYTGALVFNGQRLFSSGTVQNEPNSSLHVNTGTFINSGDMIVNAGGGISVTTSMNNPANNTLTMLGGVLSTPGLTNAFNAAINGFGLIHASMTNHGSISFNGPTQVVGNFNNSSFGHVSVRNAQTIITGFSTNNGTITTSNGTIIFDGGLLASTPGGIDGSGVLLFSSGGHLITDFVRQSSLSINGSLANPAQASVRAIGDGGAVSVVDSLNISGTVGAYTGTIDLADNNFIVGNTPIATIASYIASGFAGATWTGSGLTSSHVATVAADAGNPHKTALGYATAASLGINDFHGEAVSGDNVVVGYTLSGDANLDYKVNTLDFNHLAGSFGAPSGKHWLNGDFDYNGAVDSIDFNHFAGNYGATLMRTSAEGVVVPEPLSFLMIGTAALLFRKRR